MLQNGRTKATNYLALTFKPFAKRPLKSLRGYTLEAVISFEPSRQHYSTTP